MADLPSNKHKVSFEDFIFDCDSFELFNKGQIVNIQPKQAEVLALLIKNANKLVSREELQANVWGNRVVEFDQSINFCMKGIRQALQDDARSPKFIKTIPKKGYKFIATPEPALGPQQQKGGASRISAAVLAYSMGLIFTLSVAMWWTRGASSNNVDTEQQALNALPESSSTQFKRARYLFDKSQRDAMEASKEIFSSVLQQHPNFAPAHAYLSLAHLYTAQNEKDRQLSREHAEQGIFYDNSLAIAHIAKAKVASFLDWDINSAHSSLLKATTLDPSSVKAWHELAITSAVLGERVKAIQSVERILTLAPGAFQEKYHAGWFYLFDGQLEEAFQQCKQSTEIKPEHSYANYCAAQAASALGMFETAATYASNYVKIGNGTDEEAALVAEQMAQGNPQEFYEWSSKYYQTLNSHFTQAIGFANLKDKENALHMLRKAIDSKEGMVPTAWAFTEFSFLWQDPEFHKLMSVVKRR